MKVKDLQAAIAANGGQPVEVYYPSDTWDFKRNREDVELSRWTADGTLYFKRFGVGKFEPATHGIRGTHLKLTRPRPAELRQGEFFRSVDYIALAQVVGLYAEVAPQRRAVVEAEKLRLDDARRQGAAAERERAALVARAASLGYPPAGSDVSRTSRTARLTFNADALNRLFDEIEQARYGKPEGFWR